MPRPILVGAVLLACGMPLSTLAISAPAKKTAAKVDPASPAVERVLRAELEGFLDRRHQLAAVVEQHPDSETARWQSGFVRYGNQWRSFDEGAPSTAAADLLDKYRARRREAVATPSGQMDLADWCRKNKLPEQERAHLRSAMDLSPDADHTAILERLGNVQFGNVWLTTAN